MTCDELVLKLEHVKIDISKNQGEVNVLCVEEESDHRARTSQMQS